jgi:oligopeptide transport system permease protein
MPPVSKARPLLHPTFQALLSLKKGLSWHDMSLLGYVLLWGIGALCFDANALHHDHLLQAPGEALWERGALFAWLGTDDLGRSMWARVGLGVWVSVGLGVWSILVGWLVGVPVGLLWGEGYHRWWGQWLKEALQLWDTVPSLLWLLLASMLWTQLPSAAQNHTMSHWFSLGLDTAVSETYVKACLMGTTIGLLHASDVARLVAQGVLELKHTTASEAYETFGGNALRFGLRYSLPHVVPRLMVYSRLLLMRSILAESTLSFVGIGLQPPMSTLGVLAHDAWQLVLLTIYPFLIITSVLMALMYLLRNKTTA